MRDLLFIAYIGGIMLMAFKRPFLFVLLYAYMDIVAPQRLSYFLLNSIPVSPIILGLAILGFMMNDDKSNVRISPRWWLLILLFMYCGISTQFAAQPVEAADKWSWVWKALTFAIFLPLTLTTRLRIEAIVLTIVLCASAIIVTGGIKTAMGGGGYGVLVMLVNNNTGLYEGSIISCVAISLIPLMLWLARYGTILRPSKWLTAYTAAFIFACMLIPVGTQARTGIICIGVLGLLMLRYARYRLLYLGAAGLIAMAAIPFLPSSFTQRADTIKTYNSDESASTRIQVWMWTIDYIKSHPLGGGFDVYRQNKIRYDIQTRETDGPLAGHMVTKKIVDAGRAFHSSYFEMFGEQGYPGLLLWLLIHVGSVWRMEMVSRIYRKRNRDDEKWIAPLATALQNAQIIYLFGSFFVGIAFQSSIYMLVALHMGFDSYLMRRRQETTWRPLKSARLNAAKALQ